ncbi:hypothetical protein M378DRAFT_179842 [Amanita muscaria Koide BX008]|uniref:Uncharacterized protein n=1 Tax=Amanita muscaria (strain Koide BX008) TaxID=946122 RepID=A0A0C2WKE8_AMAMK|nr:hypothetical protein M378DRAFT_179842 [Amanita muscaria Koide BX008]
MRAFGIFSIIAAFSAALSVSAAPVGASDLSLTPVVVRSVDVANGFANLRGAAQHEDPTVESREIAADYTRRTDIKSVPEILIGVTAQVKVVVDKLDVVLAGEIDVNVVVGLLVEIKGILIAAVADVKALVGLGLDVVLALDGKVLLVADVAVYVVALIQLIVAIVVKVQAVVTAAVAIQVCIDISVALAAFLGAIFAIVGGLLVVVVTLCAEIIVVIKAHVNIFAAVIAVLAL